MYRTVPSDRSSETRTNVKVEKKQDELTATEQRMVDFISSFAYRTVLSEESFMTMIRHMMRKGRDRYDSSGKVLKFVIGRFRIISKRTVDRDDWMLDDTGRIPEAKRNEIMSRPARIHRLTQEWIWRMENDVSNRICKMLVADGIAVDRESVDSVLRSKTHDWDATYYRHEPTAKQLIDRYMDCVDRGDEARNETFDAEGQAMINSIVEPLLAAGGTR